MPQYQTIIFNRSSGTILKVLPNQYIANKKHLARMAGTQTWKHLSFIYFPYAFEIDLSAHHIAHPPLPGPAYLTDAQGTNIALLAIYAAAKTLLTKSEAILYSFEGGLGDYINQGNVISQILTQHPHKEIHISGAPDRFPLLSCFPNFEKATVTTRAKCIDAGTPSINFAQISQLDSNYPPYGKRGVYASLAGIDPAFPQGTLKLPARSLTWATQQWATLSSKKKALRISLHTRSGEPNSKTWPWDHIPVLIELLRSKYSPAFALFGGHGQESLAAPDILDGIGRFDWLQVASLIKTSHLVICIDSAIMHIAHHLDIPTLSLWGPTAASYILPQNHNTPVIEAAIDCSPCGNYMCKKGDCMQSITPAQVSKKAFSIIDSVYALTFETT